MLNLENAIDELMFSLQRLIARQEKQLSLKPVHEIPVELHAD